VRCRDGLASAPEPDGRWAPAGRTALHSRHANDVIKLTEMCYENNMSSTFLDDLRGDVPYAVRGLMRSRGFTAAAVITLGLHRRRDRGAQRGQHRAAGAAAYKDADRLVRIVERAAPANPSAPLLRRTGMSWTELTAWRKESQTLSEIAVSITPPITLAVGFVGVLREFASPHAQGAFQISFGGSIVPRLHEVGVDGRLLGLARALALITALLVGAMPAFRMSRVDHAQVMSYRGATSLTTMNRHLSGSAPPNARSPNRVSAHASRRERRSRSWLYLPPRAASIARRVTPPSKRAALVSPRIAAAYRSNDMP
jgi:hypothetical protein